jgi:peptide/histidine transporter 3/4
VIQFGFDQLHDSPAESSTLYIHWYVWTNQVGLFLLRLPSAVFSGYYKYTAYTFTPVLALVALIVLGITLCFEKFKNHWFLIEFGSTNPYKLVYKVVKFAKDHTNPVRRSAFTYCEDELPSRLDLGKEKYGGPFTTEQVENVKAFLGIIRVLLTIGPTFFADVAFGQNLPGLVHITTYDDYYYYPYHHVHVPYYAYFYGSGCLTPLLMLVFIPVYLCLLRPLIHAYIPGMLKRIGLGMLLSLISGFCTLVMGVATYNCIGESCTLRLSSYLNVSSHFLLIQYGLNAVSYLLIYIASYEFLCAQSPQSMKGLLIGAFFAIKGVFQLFGVALYLAVGVGCRLRYNFPVCGFVYYLINVVIALIGIIAFVLVARRYQYRQRDEPDNIYRYAEEYYANAQEESSYCYDNDGDNLNVETIRN